MTPTSKRRPNHLAGESSPYLLQHAGNPVDWRPWGAEALELARREDRPIFLSIGYAACHWCHVMERESFEDGAVATFLNAHFVPVKVDREERPDLDAVYMDAVQALTGSGGWPLSVFLTPDLRPFYGGTYFPPERRWGRPSFLELLEAIAEAWATQRPDVEAGAAQLAARLAAGEPDAPGRLDVRDASTRALASLAHAFDGQWGGFGAAPKFPSPARLSFLLEHAARGDESARGMLAGTLDGMAAGGMWDWVGGGFHRYSVDATWLVPHFEKMLYDNALLARLYGEAGVRLAEPRWVAIARRTADYLLREMRGPEGGFFSSTDADSEGEEGRFFTWTADEVRLSLAPDEAAGVIRLCELDGNANFEGGRSVLRPFPARVEARVLEAAERGRARLLEVRSARRRPATDDKRLAGWNGMAVWALAWLGATLEEPRFLSAARAAARHLRDSMVRPDGRLERSWRDGRTGGVETLEDVAWVAAGWLELYQAVGDHDWLAAADALVGARLPHYLGAGGQLFDTPDDGEALPLRPRGGADGALPASSAVMAATLVRLAALLDREEYAERARGASAADAAMVRRAPEAFTSLLQAAALAARAPRELVVIGEPGSPRTTALIRAARTAPTPPDVMVLAPAPQASAAHLDLVPALRGRAVAAADEAAAFLCVGGACRLPTADPEDLARQLALVG